MKKWLSIAKMAQNGPCNAQIQIQIQNSRQIKNGGNRVIKIRHFYNKYNETDLRKFTNKAAVDVSTAFRRKKKRKKYPAF